jgi:hypothetical protein
MKSRYYWVIILLFLMPLSALGEEIETVGTPQLYMPEKSYNFQSVVSGMEVSHTYVVQNKGTATLEIMRVATG